MSARMGPHRRTTLSALAIVALALLTLGGIAPAKAQPTPSDGMFTAEFCNYSGTEAAVAVAGHLTPGGQGVTRGWARIPDLQCVSVGRYAQGPFDYFVKFSNGWVSIGGRKDICAPDSQFYSPWVGGSCTPNEQVYKFVEEVVANSEWTHSLLGAIPDEASLPRATTAAVAESQSMYDACSATWNSDDWKSKPLPKAMAAGVRHNPDGTLSALCYRLWGGADIVTVINGVHQACVKDGWTCFDFARTNNLTPWAYDEYQAIKSGQRK